jgi:hypothetical protein
MTEWSRMGHKNCNNASKLPLALHHTSIAAARVPPPHRRRCRYRCRCCDLQTTMAHSSEHTYSTRPDMRSYTTTISAQFCHTWMLSAHTYTVCARTAGAGCEQRVLLCALSHACAVTWKRRGRSKQRTWTEWSGAEGRRRHSRVVRAPTFAVPAPREQVWPRLQLCRHLHRIRD